ncbi:hypothetical protein PTUN_a1642 [Pseudoalteromonas tunicata]|nr:hypothetical protein PTUN_a1642 [Pseudoalteromonas tunicata]
MTVKLKNLGNLQVLAISDTEMTAKVYSHYHFSKKIASLLLIKQINSHF